ncbi:hypothetical protein QCA50_016224 [Cerrena zonata]|uniref:Ornithine aminotransferase n=1 Tax=Cerrena zonata TaxID=2478898 RepID=A0AAW0FSZ3_9APHY
MSTDPDATTKFGPYLSGVGPQIPGEPQGTLLRYGVIEDVEKAFNNAGDKIAAILLEPIQGEAGIVVPPEGKAISGGVLPVSGVLSSKEIMLTLEPGSHGSTYGGNPLACRVATAALEVVKNENLVERSNKLGDLLRSKLTDLKNEFNGIIAEVRGVGLLSAIVIDESKANGRTAWDLCLLMKDQGVLAKPTHDNIIRLAPPLVISEEDLLKGVDAIKKSLTELPNAPKAHH